MQLEGEDRLPPGRARPVSRLQSLLQAGTAPGHIQPCLLGQPVGAFGQGDGRAPPQMAIFILQAKGPLDPGGDGVLAEFLVAGGMNPRFDCLTESHVGQSRIPFRLPTYPGPGEATAILRGWKQRLVNHMFRADRHAEQPAGHLRDLVQPLLTAAASDHSSAGADTQEVGIAASLTQAANQHGHVGPLAAAVSVQFVQHQEFQLSHRPVHKHPFAWSGEHELQHDIVGEQQVRRILQDLLLALQCLLAGVAGKAHREGLPRACRRVGDVGRQPFQALQLRVDEGVHRIDDDGTYTVSIGVVLEHVVNDGHEVGEALAGTGAGGEDVRLALCSQVNGPFLVAVQVEGVTVAGEETSTQGV